MKLQSSVLENLLYLNWHTYISNLGIKAYQNLDFRILKFTPKFLLINSIRRVPYRIIKTFKNNMHSILSHSYLFGLFYYYSVYYRNFSQMYTSVPRHEQIHWFIPNNFWKLVLPLFGHFYWHSKQLYSQLSAQVLTYRRSTIKARRRITEH